MHSRLFATFALLGALFVAPSAFALPCSLMPTISVDGGTVTDAVAIPGPSYVAPDGTTYSGLPPFCKVSVVATPTPDSLINIEVWLPQTWNGRRAEPRRQCTWLGRPILPNSRLAPPHLG